MTIALAATTLDFETGVVDDFLRVMVDPDGAGPQGFTTLANFQGDGSGSITDTISGMRLTEIFQDLTLSIPEDADDLVVRIEAGTTFWNEIVAFDNIRITAGPTLIDGDTNGDGIVDINDLNNVRNNFGIIGSDDGSLEGDAFPFDGLVDINDLNGVRNNFGNVVPSPVPEPSSLLLALLGAGVVFCRRRRATLG